MKAATILMTASSLAGSALALPTLVKKQDIDATVLQFALTLEHLENVFYKEALSQFTQKDFEDAGFDEEYFSNLKYIAHDEESHVQVLSKSLTAAGATPVAACEYKFPFTDVHSFITLSSVLEGVGTAAYLGGAPLITNKEYLTAAGSILVTEALHTSMQRHAAGNVPAANPYGTPLSPNPVYTLAASFITSCPESNAALPFKAFPALAAVQGNPAAPMQHFQFSSPAMAPTASHFVTYVSGLDVVSRPVMNIQGNNFFAEVPAEAMGQTYALLTSADVSGKMLDDSVVVAGPAILEVTPPSPTYDTSIM